MYLDFLKVLRFSFLVVVVGFYPIMNGFTDGPSIRPNHTTLNVTWAVLIQSQLNCVFFGEQYFDFILFPVFKYKALGGCFIFLHLSTLPRPDFPGSDGTEKKITNILFWVRTLQSFFFMFSFMVHANLATILYWAIPENIHTQPRTASMF